MKKMSHLFRKFRVYQSKSPYSNDKFIEYSEEEKTSKTLYKISKLALKHRIYILAGSIPEKEDSKIFNTSYLFNKKGKIIAKHRKMHLFDIDVKNKIYFKESDVLTAGNKITIANTETAARRARA